MDLSGKMRRQIIMSSGAERFSLPVVPARYQIQTEQLNKIVDILDFGEMALFGNSALAKIKLSGFFPATFHNYPFVTGDVKEPAACIELITKWRTDKSPVRLIITDSTVNLMAAIKQFDYRERDGTRDVYFDLSLVEYKNWNTPASNNDKALDAGTGLKERMNLSGGQNQFAALAQDYFEYAKILTGTTQSAGTFKHLQRALSWL